MAINKITNYKNNNSDFTCNKLKDSGGTTFSLGSVSTGQTVVSSGSYIVGLTPCYGELSYGHAETPAAATLWGDTSATAFIWTKLTGSKSVLGDASNFTSSAVNRLNFTGDVLTGRNTYMANASITFSSSVATTVDFAFAISGVVQSASIASRYPQSGSLVTSGEWNNVALCSLFALTASQYVEIFTRTRNTTLITHPSASFTIVQI